MCAGSGHLLPPLFQPIEQARMCKEARCQNEGCGKKTWWACTADDCYWRVCWMDADMRGRDKVGMRTAYRCRVTAQGRRTRYADVHPIYAISCPFSGLAPSLTGCARSFACSQSVMSSIPASEQCSCPPEKHNAANPLTSFIQGLWQSSSSSSSSSKTAKDVEDL